MDGAENMSDESPANLPKHTINLLESLPYPTFRVLSDSKGFPTGFQACTWCGATTSDAVSRNRHEAWHLDSGHTAPDA